VGAYAPTGTRPPVFERREKVLLVGLYAAIVATTVAAFAATLLIGRTYGVFIGLGILAYVLGLRHGVDADHICAIDNTTRKLLQENKRPLTVGTWFSLGHSTIVVVLIVALGLATQWIRSHIPAFQSVGGIIGTSVSGVFLFVIAFVNLLIFLSIYRIFRELRTGRLDNAGLEEQLNKRGFMNRYFNFLFKVVNEPWQIYPIGVLFGLGFDTATEVALIAITLTYAAGAIPLGVILILPLLFTCGMVLTDTTDGVGMRFAYGWAFMKPIRKIYYNLTMTIISVLVAFLIGGIELLGVVGTELHLTGGPFGLWDSVGYLTSTQAWEFVGFAIVALFAICWGVAWALYRWKRYEETGLGPAPVRTGVP
jgi:high-affinity nickel-transport protein